MAALLSRDSPAPKKTKSRGNVSKKQGNLPLFLFLSSSGEEEVKG